MPAHDSRKKAAKKFGKGLRRLRAAAVQVSVEAHACKLETII